MQMFITSPDTQREVNKLRTYALSNVYDFSHGIIPDDHTPAGDNPNHILYNGTTKIVYSIEIQPNEQLGQCHHLSISKNGSKPVNPVIISEVMKQFGMGELEDDKVRKLYMEGDNKDIINIVQPMEKTCPN